tara:strand:+ start:17033 stop:17506 length:474 start_codon:yes stop_codon:yes gene_type:complete
MKKLTHINSKGEAKIVDIGNKNISSRTATCSGKVIVSEKTIRLIQEDKVKKGDVLSVARIAGIMASKKTAELIPLCHNIPIEHINIDLEIDLDNSAIIVKSTCKTNEKTGIEMEAMVATSITCLTIYDMVKSVDKGAAIKDIMLNFKSGGKTGIYNR